MKQVWYVLASLGLAAGLLAQGGEQITRIHVRQIGDQLVTRCALKSSTASVTSHMWVEIGRPGALQLHHQAAASLGVGGHGGTMDVVTIELDGDDLRVTEHAHGDERRIDRFNQAHIAELAEIPCRGGIGARAFADGLLLVDLRNSVLTLEPTPQRDRLPSGPEKDYLHAQFVDGVAWLDVDLPDGSVGRIAIDSSRYDSVLDEKLFDQDTVAPSLRIADQDLSRIIAWRPEPLSPKLPAGAVGVLGINFLLAFRVELDAQNGYVGLTRIAANARQRRPAPEVGLSAVARSEQACFAARARREPAPLVAWLQQNQGHRLAGEAARWLLDLQIDRGAAAADIEAAADWLSQSTAEEFRSSLMIEVFDDLIARDHVDAAVMVAELGVASARGGRYPRSVYRLQLRLGEVMLARHEDEQAWRYLLSAAFGLNDAVGTAERTKVNLLLGELYERRGKYERALGRYVQAVVAKDGGGAIAAIERLQRAHGKPFSVDVVDELTSGRVDTIVAPDRFVADARTDTNRCVLVELFTNPHFGVQVGDRWSALTVGGAAVIHGLLTHFPRDRVAVLTWHTDFPRAASTMNELALREYKRVGEKPLIVVDGLAAGPSNLRSFEADPIHRRLTQTVREELARKSPYELALQATCDGRGVRGWLEVRGPEADVQVQIVLAERGVIHPGLGATVVHRMLARAPLTAGMDGVAFAPKSGKMALRFDRELAAIEAANEQFLQQFEARTESTVERLSMHLDPAQLCIVALVRDRLTDRVLQAICRDVSGTSEESPR